MFEDNPSGKVRFRALGELPEPGTCLICGSGTREQGYVDIGVWLEYVGEGLICYLCVVEIAEKIKMMIPEEVQHIQNLAQTLASENEQLKLELAASNERLSHYDALFSKFSSFASHPANGAHDRIPEDDPEPALLSGSGESASEESDSDDGGFSGFGASEQDDGSSEDSAQSESLLKL